MLTDELGTTSEKGVVYQFTDAQQAEFDKLVAAQRQAQDEMSVSWAGHLNNFTRNFADSINEISNRSADMFGSFSALAQLHFQQSGQENEKYFQNYKRLASAETIISTAAVVNTMRDTRGGPLAKIAAGTAVGLAGAAQLATINRTQPGSSNSGFRSGGLVKPEIAGFRIPTRE